MANTYTVDASVFLNAFNPYEAGHGESHRFLARLQELAIPIIVPTLLLPEVAAAISQWLKQAREGGGPEALHRRKAPGARPRLTPEQLARIPELLERGAEAHGFRGDVWTRERVGKVIEREFGVSYHATHVGRILRNLGWSQQKPVERASQRNEAAIQR